MKKATFCYILHHYHNILFAFFVSVLYNYIINIKNEETSYEI